MSQLRKNIFRFWSLVVIIGVLGISLKGTPLRVSAQEEPDEVYFFPLFVNTTQPPTSTSYYMITVDPTFTYSLGCELGTRDALKSGAQNSVMVLDFSYPVDYGNGTFGAELFGFGPVPLTSIETAVHALMLGYYQCTGVDNNSNLVVGVGTNNKSTSTNTMAKMTAHGAAWAGMVNRINQWAKDSHIFQQVQAYGASDIELGWNTPAMSRAWVDGYQAAASYPYIHFGDAAGCPYKDRPYLDCGTSSFPQWTSNDVWYVAYGATPALPMPLIYLTNGIHAEQWAFLSRYSVQSYGFPITFSGVFTQSQACAQWGCNGTDNTPEEAYQQLSLALREDSATSQNLQWKTDIRWILRSEAYPRIYPASSTPESSHPTPLADVIKSLQTSLDESSLSSTSRGNITDKLSLLESLASEIAQAGRSPALKSGKPSIQSSPTSAPTFREGIFTDATLAGLPYGSAIVNQWQQASEQGFLQISAGTAPDDANQGALYILQTALDKSTIKAFSILTDKGSGALAIIAETPQGLLIRSENGTQFILDWDSLTLNLLPH